LRSGFGCGADAGGAAGSAGAGAVADFLAASSATDFAGAAGWGSFFWQAPSVASATIAKVNA
jgi:hypothetical protein